MRKIILAVAVLLLFPNCAQAIDISAEAGVVMVADTNAVIFEKNSDMRLPMASTTKIMTAAVALEKSSPDDIVTVSANAERQEGSSIYLRRGDKIRMEDLLYGLMLNSGNDAAVAVAEYISGSVEAFSGEMNELSKKIGAKNSSFKNPNGLDDEEHYTTAYDLALITGYAMKNESFRKIVATKEASAKINNSEILYFNNHNKLLKMYDGAVGVKTGFTKRSGRCLVSAAERDGITLIAVTLNAPDDWNDHMKMLDMGFSRCSIKNVLSANQVIKTINTTEGERVGAVIRDGISVAAVDGKTPSCDIRLYVVKSLAAPIGTGEKIGEAEVYMNGNLYKRTDIVSDRDVVLRVNTFADELLRVVKKWENCYLQSL